jgi:2-oxoglutarate dehydrogenase E2 component (dihydrolipoamide succinyltransferase)
VKKYNLDVTKISGTGRGGRVTHDDVQNYLKTKSQAGAAPKRGNRRVAHSVTRRRIAEHMVHSLLKTAPHVTAVFDADLSAIVSHRNQCRFVAAAAKALQAVPEINSRWHVDELEIFADYNIGVAAATDSGLIVPVIHCAQDLDLFGIAARLHELTERARKGKLTPDDLRGGTFTITNHGVSGSLIATPIINQPQCAILGIGKMEKRVIVSESDGADSIQIRPMAFVTLTIDHRALDGYQANAFLSHFVKTLRDWPAVQ